MSAVGSIRKILNAFFTFSIKPKCYQVRVENCLGATLDCRVALLVTTGWNSIEMQIVATLQPLLQLQYDRFGRQDATKFFRRI